MNYPALKTGRFKPFKNFAKRLSIAASLLFVLFALVPNSEAQEIKFETADGKFKITGTVGYYVANGKPVESPTGDEKGLSVVIIRPDGKPTNPVPVRMLSKKTKQILFRNLERPPLAIAPFDERKAKAHQKAWAKHLGLPVESTNSIGMKFVVIPPGEFTMGSDIFESEEKPAHKVKITRPFRLALHEVTQAQYAKVVGANPSKFKGSVNPVDMVSWTDAVAFCNLLSNLPEEKAAGRTYRLPTEAEWEYACRAGTTTDYSCGNDSARLVDYGWDNSNSGSQTHPVGQRKANAWGLYDMHGNVWEWCQDWYGDYPQGSVTDPSGASSGSLRVRRGGGFGGPAGYCRSAYRGRNNQSARTDYGFRVVCVPAGK